MRLALLVLALVPAAVAQPAPIPTLAAAPTAYVGGRWFDGTAFVARDTTWADDGVFVARLASAPVRVVELGGEYVVPPFGDAHLHALYSPESLGSTDSLLVSRGVFYVLNPHVSATDRAAVRGTETVVDVAYAVGGVTTARSHLATAFEARALGLQPWDVWGPRGDEIRASRRVEGDAYHLAPAVDDLDAVWPLVLDSGTDVVKVILNRSQGWADGDPEAQAGVSPAVLREVVRRSRAAGLRVVAHVETAADLRVAIEAGVDVLAHAPGYGVVDGDPATAESGAFALDGALLRDWAASGIPVTPTLARGPLSARYLPSPPSPATLDTVRAAHARLLRQLDAAGVPIAFGADSGGLWVWDDAAYAVEAGGLTPLAALRAWSVTTPRAAFPDRAIGRLAPGFEASLLSLACDPTADWACTERVRVREKQGRAVGQAPRLHPSAGATAYVGGRWFDGERFAARDTTWAVGGVFVPARPAGWTPEAGRVVRLGGRFVVPPFGDAHTHMLSDVYTSPGQVERFERDGVFYALVLTDRYTWAAPLLPTFAGAETIDVAYAHGGLSSDRTHPSQVYEWQALRLVGRELTPGDRRRIQESRLAEDDAYWSLDSLDDLDATWDAFLAHNPDVVKVYLLDAAGELGPATSGMTGLPTGRGLSPAVLRAVVERAHAAGLRVIAHVETGADMALAVESGADGFAHLPGYGYRAGRDAPYLIDDATLAASGERRLTYVPTSVVGDSYNQDRPARAAIARDLHRRQLRRLHDAGARIALGADRWNVTSKGEADFMNAHGFFDRATLLDLWSRVTPQVVFPDRAIGRLGAGFEASLLALACDPLADWACTGQIVHREKQGQTLGDDSAAEAAALRYQIRVDPQARQLRVEGTWAGGDLTTVDHWARRALWGRDRDSSSVAEAEQVPGGVRFRYTVDVPERPTENTPDVSLNGRRLRTWGWDVLRFPVVRGAEPSGPVAVRYLAPDGWRAATPFGDAAQAEVTAPSLDDAARTPVLAGRIRVVEAGRARLAVRAEHPVPDSVFALALGALVGAQAAYTGRAPTVTPFAAIDLTEGKPLYAAGNFVASPSAVSFVALSGGGDPREAGYWNVLAHELAHAYTPGALVREGATFAGTADGRAWPWFREGLTEYVGDRTAHLAGLLSDAELADQLTESLQNYAEVGTAADDASRAYAEGAVVALGLDAALAAETGGRATLRDWALALLDRHAGPDAPSVSLASMREAARQLAGDRVASLFDRLTSEDPPTVRAALRDALEGSGVRLGGTGAEAVVSFDPAPSEAAAFAAFLDPTRQDPAGRRATRERLRQAAQATPAYDYPLVPTVPIATDRLADFAAGLGSPAGGAWTDLAFGDGAQVTAEVDRLALRVAGWAGAGYGGAGVSLPLGTADETADLSAYDGIEVDLDVAEGPVQIQLTSSIADRRDLPVAVIGPTDGRVTRRIAWDAFAQRTPTPGWSERAASLQVLVMGRGEPATAFVLHDVRLYRDRSEAL